MRAFGVIAAGYVKLFRRNLGVQDRVGNALQPDLTFSTRQNARACATSPERLQYRHTLDLGVAGFGKPQTRCAYHLPIRYRHKVQTGIVKTVVFFGLVNPLLHDKDRSPHIHCPVDIILPGGAPEDKLRGCFFCHRDYYAGRIGGSTIGRQAHAANVITVKTARQVFL